MLLLVVRLLSSHCHCILRSFALLLTSGSAQPWCREKDVRDRCQFCSQRLHCKLCFHNEFIRQLILFALCFLLVCILVPARCGYWLRHIHTSAIGIADHPFFILLHVPSGKRFSLIHSITPWCTSGNYTHPLHILRLYSR